MSSSPAPTRHPRGIAYAVLFLVGAGYLTYLGISRDGWWLLALIPAFVMTMAGVGGLVDDIPKRPRDERGRLLSKPRRELTQYSPPESKVVRHFRCDAGRLVSVPVRIVRGWPMAWRLARSLENLRSEINELAPDRSKASDGTIGDDPHQGRPSDHNPNASNVVCAFDATHDPGSGADMHRISEHIRVDRHNALKYVIFSRRIASASSDWKWTAYNGSNPHTTHMHVSVGRGPDGQSTGPYDDGSPWGLAKGDDVIGLRKGDSGERVKGLQAALGRAGFHTTVDGEYGPNTSSALLKCRKAMGSDATSGDKVDGYAYAQLLSALAKEQTKTRDD